MQDQACLEWMAIGFAMVNTRIAKHMRDLDLFTDKDAREFWDALVAGGGPKALVRVKVAGSLDEPAFLAVLRKVAERADLKRNEWVANNVQGMKSCAGSGPAFFAKLSEVLKQVGEDLERNRVGLEAIKAEFPVKASPLPSPALKIVS